MLNSTFPRIDKDPTFATLLRKYCRLKPGAIWEDPKGKHKVACCDALDKSTIDKVMDGEKAALAIHDPPYNLVAFQILEHSGFVKWSKEWIGITDDILKKDSYCIIYK